MLQLAIESHRHNYRLSQKNLLASLHVYKRLVNYTNVKCVIMEENN